MVQLKGCGRTLVRCETGRGRYDLVTFADGSWGVLRDGAAVGVWEADERGDCLRTFGTAVGLDRRPLAVVVARPGTLQSPAEPAGLPN